MRKRRIRFTRPHHGYADIACGLCTQGGFEITQLVWKKGRITNLKIRSTLGGNLRLQVPNEVAVQKVKGIKLANGANPNALFTAIDIPAALIVPDSPIQQLELKKTWVYDKPTEKGKVYEVLFV